MSNPSSPTTRTVTVHAEPRLVAVTVVDTIAASPEAIWAILADDFLEISTWARGVNSSSTNPATPDGLNGSPHGGRVCDVDGMGLTDERITDYDAQRRTLTYSVAAKKLPFFVDILSSTWSVQSGSTADNSLVTLTVQARTRGILGGVGRRPLRSMLSKGAPALMRDLTTWAESSSRTVAAQS